MRCSFLLASLFTAALAGIALPSAAQQTAIDTPKARSRCLAVADEVSYMMDQVESEQKAAEKAGGPPTPTQVENADKLDKEYTNLAYMWANLTDYFEDADPPGDDIKAEIVLMSDDDFVQALDICDGLMDKIDAEDKSKMP